MTRPRNPALEVLRPHLDETGLPWTTELGKNHTKVKLAGRLVTVVPHGSGKTTGRHFKNNVAAIRRAAKELRG